MTEFTKNRHNEKNGTVTKNALSGTFTENLLRSVLSLKPCRQYNLVWNLAHGEIDKAGFKKQALLNKAREAMFSYCRGQIGKAILKHVRQLV